MTIPQPKPFAFYGRVSTEDNQDPESSRSWQLTRATLIQPHGGHIAAEYFDVVQSGLLVPLTAADQPQAPPGLRAALASITVDDYATHARLPQGV